MASASTRAASRSSDLVCEAITARRSRDVPAGTVGGRIAWANTPRSSARSQAAIAASGSPTISGTIGVSPGSTAIPASPSASRRTVELRCSFSTRRGCSRSRSSAAIAAAIAGGGSAVEKISVRAVLIRYFAIGLSQRTYAPYEPSDLPSVPTITSTSSSSPCWATSPRPPGPTQPVPCASSTITRVS
jgi:hypothetical protein